MGDSITSTTKTSTAGNYKLTNENTKEKSKLQNCTIKNNEKSAKKKRRAKSDLGDNFVAPDGGWGWFVSIASGVNTLVTFALTQQFGIIFRNHMFNLGITNSQITTIINVQIAITSITGIFNGPIFRRFSFRQVAVFGSILTFIGLVTCIFANSFLFYLLTFSCCYGFGRRLIVSASSLAVNTYFKKRRRTATSYQFGVAGLGPICLPYVATFLLDYYGVAGTILCFAGISLNNIACSLIYQPVKWHVKKLPQDLEASEKLTPQVVDDQVNDICPSTKDSPNSTSNRNSINSQDKFQEVSKYSELKSLNNSDNDQEDQDNDISTSTKDSLNSFSKSKSINSINKEVSKNSELKSLNNSSDSIKSSSNCSIQEEKLNNDQEHQDKKEVYQDQEELLLLRDNETEKKQETDLIEEELEIPKKYLWYTKVVEFFDLDLLRDFTFVNLIMGLTLINFVELNFAILTPFILSDFGFEKQQIALAMSLLGTLDLIIRFLIPLITARINLSNKTFFILGIMGMCIGRIFLSFTRNYYIMIGIFIWLGFTKAFRTVFWSLIIPGYVPLKRLPAAAGLNQLMAGLFSLAFGPFIGLIRDKTNYTFALNFLNALGLLAISAWILEALIRKYGSKTRDVTDT